MLDNIKIAKNSKRWQKMKEKTFKKIATSNKKYQTIAKLAENSKTNKRYQKSDK